MSMLLRCCPPGSTTWDLNDFQSWLDLPQAHPNYSALAVYGEPGTGKSTLCAALLSDPRFRFHCHHFCRRDSRERGSALRVMHTLMYQLCQSAPGFRQRVLDAMVGAPEALADLFDPLEVKATFRRLIKGPLRDTIQGRNDGPAHLRCSGSGSSTAGDNPRASSSGSTSSALSYHDSANSAYQSPRQTPGRVSASGRPPISPLTSSRSRDPNLPPLSPGLSLGSTAQYHHSHADLPHSPYPLPSPHTHALFDTHDCTAGGRPMPEAPHRVSSSSGSVHPHHPHHPHYSQQQGLKKVSSEASLDSRPSWGLADTNMSTLSTLSTLGDVAVGARGPATTFEGPILVLVDGLDEAEGAVRHYDNQVGTGEGTGWWREGHLADCGASGRLQVVVYSVLLVHELVLGAEVNGMLYTCITIVTLQAMAPLLVLLRDHVHVPSADHETQWCHTAMVMS